MHEKVVVAAPSTTLEPASADTRSRVLTLALPAVGEQMLNMMVGIVDTFLVGHLGAAALAGVGLGNQVVMLATAILAALATGTTALVARHLGAREPATADRILHQSIILGAALGVATAVLSFVFARESMVLLGAREDVVDLAATYLRIVAPTLLAGALMFVGNAALRGAGDTRAPMQVMGVVNVVNIIVAYTLIYGLGPFPALGVAGSALGAALGRSAGCLLVLFMLLRGRAGLQLSLRALHIDVDQMRRLVNVGLPAAGEMVLMRSGMTFYAAVVASLGTAAYAAHQVIMTSESLSFMPGFGFSVAAATLVGQGLGARNPQQAEDGGKASHRLAVLLMSGMGILLLVCARQFLSFFTSDQEVINLGVVPLSVAAVSQPLLATSMVLAGALRGAGDTRWPMFVTGLGIWVVRIPLGLLLVQTPLGLTGAWAAMMLDQAVRGSIFFWRFRSGRWKTLRV